MAKSKTRGARKSAKPSKRGAKKAAQPRSARAAKNARKAAKPKSSTGGRRSAKTRPTAKKTAAAKRGAASRRSTAAKRSAVAQRSARASKRTSRPPSKTSRQAARPVTNRNTTSATSRKAPASSTARRTPNLDRQRRTVAETDGFPTPPSSLDMDRSASAARSGRAELVQKLQNHTSTSPAMTGGDIDADWESAETVGDEAPGGDNPTPDQDVVEEIGKALGVEYADDEELQGGDEIIERDRKRWELDPASSDDFDDRE